MWRVMGRPPVVAGSLPDSREYEATVGSGVVAGKSRRFPCAVGCAAVMLTETALAVAGMPHPPKSESTRSAPAPRTGTSVQCANIEGEASRA